MASSPGLNLIGSLGRSLRLRSCAILCFIFIATTVIRKINFPYRSTSPSPSLGHHRFEEQALRYLGEVLECDVLKEEEEEDDDDDGNDGKANSGLKLEKNK